MDFFKFFSNCVIYQLLITIVFVVNFNDAYKSDDNTVVDLSMFDHKLNRFNSNNNDGAIDDFDIGDVVEVPELPTSGSGEEEKRIPSKSDVQLSNLKILLNNLRNRHSMFRTFPFSYDVLDKYINEYMRQIDRLSEKGIKINHDRINNDVKRAVCGSLNGNPAYKWICW